MDPLYDTENDFLSGRLNRFEAHKETKFDSPFFESITSTVILLAVQLE